MYNVLDGLRVVECASFIAGPFAALSLQQLGAEVVRIDSIGGGPDFRRWPLSPGGSSLYWEGLNKGKKSVAIDLGNPAGRDLAVRIATADGERAGILVTNYPVDGFLAHRRLTAHRPDLISVRIMGWNDGRQAVDYTVNSAVGMPLMTGPEDDGRPVNHVLPAWDVLAGSQAALMVLAAEHYRRASGEGAEIRIPLSDVAASTLGHLGQIGEVVVGGADRQRIGNDLFGAFGRDFSTGDGRRVMVVAITSRQWQGLVTALEIARPVAAVEQEHGVSFAADEGLRFVHRKRLFAVVETAIALLSMEALAQRFDAHGVCWGPYQPLSAAIADERLVAGNPIFAEILHPSGYRYAAAGAAATIVGADRADARRAPRLGEHTDEVLADRLGLPEHEIAALHDGRIVAGAAE